MTGYIARRGLQTLPVLLLVTLVVFVVMRTLPGDPILALVGNSESNFDAETLAALREKYGLDDPLPVQYVEWLGSALRGDLGISTRNGLPVAEQIRDRFPATLQLGVFALLIALVIGIPAGVIAAIRRNSPADVAVTLVAMFGVAVPNFWFSMILIWVFVVELGWLPASGFVGVWQDPVRALEHIALPAIALGLALSASIMRQTRSQMLEVLSQDYVRTARAKGLRSWTVVMQHALRNALLPVVTVIGLQIEGLLAGSVIVESMFSIPGIGRLAVQAINQRDYPTLQGAVLLFGVTTVLVNLITDLMYAFIDPRIKYA
jgi:peptide/nickel transport system permease protein